jgi:hypothetical protein
MQSRVADTTRRSPLVLSLAHNMFSAGAEDDLPHPRLVAPLTLTFIPEKSKLALMCITEKTK